MSNTLNNRNFTSVASALRSRALRLAATIGLGLALFSGTLLGAVRADEGGMQFIVNHVYVNYTVDYIPCSSGSIEDVTYAVEDGHVHDLHGNDMVLQSNNTVTNANSEVVGFRYMPSPGQ